MLGTKTRMLLHTVRTYVTGHANQRLCRLVEKTHPADLALIFAHLRPSEAVEVLKKTASLEKKAEIISEVEPEIAMEILANFEATDIAELLQEMASDDAAQILENFDDEVRASILGHMQDNESRMVEERLEYDDETAGRIMVSEFLALSPETTATDAMTTMRTSEDIEVIYYLYVTSEGGQLAGIVSMRQLIMAGPDTPLKDLMAEDVVAVHATDDQEDVARVVARYNLLAVPVVDSLGKLLGIITVDDIIDIIKDEADEDMLRLAGTMDDTANMVTGSAWSSVRVRWPWLLASWFGGMFAFYVTDQFQEALTKVVLLAAFIPIVLGMGGNVGSQSSILVVRGLATRLIDYDQIWRVMFREVRIGALLGLLYGVLLAIAVMVMGLTGLVSSAPVSAIKLAAVVAAGVFASMLVATIIGSTCPLLLDKMGIDPAIATGPLVTTSVDVLGVLVYFTIAVSFLGL